jgi:hypothetical protein
LQVFFPFPCVRGSGTTRERPGAGFASCTQKPSSRRVTYSAKASLSMQYVDAGQRKDRRGRQICLPALRMASHRLLRHRYRRSLGTGSGGPGAPGLPQEERPRTHPTTRLNRSSRTCRPAPTDGARQTGCNRMGGRTDQCRQAERGGQELRRPASTRQLTPLRRSTDTPGLATGRRAILYYWDGPSPLRRANHRAVHRLVAPGLTAVPIRCPRCQIRCPLP